jgi:hypothetical protein
MAQPRSTRKTLFKISMVLIVPIAILGGCFGLDAITMSKAKPPESVRTIKDFVTWQKGAIKGRGEFENGGVTYTVMLGRPARSLASGPSAYLFDTNGQFVDWTADMGDFHTVKHRFDLASGHVKNIEHEKP